MLEPILMNVGLCMPQPGFLQGLREIVTKNGALLIFDEVKTGAKLGWGAASEYFGVAPDMICLAKSIGGGLPLAAFGTHRSVMDLISQHKVFHGGTYNTNPVSMAAGLATFREVLTRENYAHVDKLSKKLVEGYRKTISKTGLAPQININGSPIAVVANLLRIKHQRPIRPCLRNVRLQSGLRDRFAVPLSQLFAEFIHMRVILTREHFAEGRQPRRHRNRIGIVGSAVKDFVL